MYVPVRLTTTNPMREVSLFQILTNRQSLLGIAVAVIIGQTTTAVRSCASSLAGNNCGTRISQETAWPFLIRISSLTLRKKTLLVPDDISSMKSRTILSMI